MPLNPGSWSVIGTLAAFAIVAGSILLVVYAVRRGLVHRELDGTIETEGNEGTIPAAAGGAAAPSRTLGLAGVTLVVAGLALGLVGVLTGPSSGGSAAAAPGTAPKECAQSWAGCPAVTPRP